jgi:DNA-binding transcriptional regulator YdaS (Cro superfamily)
MPGYSNPIERIVSHFGGQTPLARMLGTRQSTVWEWVNQARVPSAKIPEVISAAARLDPPVILQPNDFFVMATEAR